MTSYNNTEGQIWYIAIHDYDHEYYMDFDYEYCCNGIDPSEFEYLDEQGCLEWCSNKMQTSWTSSWTRYSACELWDNSTCYIYGNNELPITGGNGASGIFCYAYSKDIRLYIMFYYSFYLTFFC